MRLHLTKLAGAATVAGLVSVVAIPSAYASNLVNGSISALGKTCNWTNATSTSNPPNTATIEADTINPPGGSRSCSSGVSATLNNNPSVSFSGTAATVNEINATVSYDGITCAYQATDAALTESGGSEDYSETASASRTGGIFLCPSSVSLSSTLDFH